MIDQEILLLADQSPLLRLRVLRELLDAPEDDPEVGDLRTRIEAYAPVATLLTAEPDGLLENSFRLCRLAYAGVASDHPAIASLAEAVFAQQRSDGSFPIAIAGRKRVPYEMVPLQTALPLRGLAAAGYVTDPRAERAYEWLLAQRLDDGAWPTGTSSGQQGFVAGYRRLPGSGGCRANTTGALVCLALHPDRARSDAARAALDLLLQRETREEWTLGTEVARLVGVEPAAGFFTFYGRFDLALVLDLASRIGAAADDPRVDDLVRFVESLRHGPLWEHPEHPELSRWLTFDLMLSMRRLAGGDWAGLAFRTPFRAYPRERRRY